MKIIILSGMLAFIACSSPKEEKIDHVHPKNGDTMKMGHTPRVDTAFRQVKFDSKYDLSCGMPLTAGLTDTAHYEGKVYGFCSPECKSDFEKHADSLVKAGR